MAGYISRGGVCATQSILLHSRSYIRIRLRSVDFLSDIEFVDDRTEEVLRMILRELICFRREPGPIRDCPCEVSMSDPFLEWFALILGNVYTDRSLPLDGSSGSDLKYAFALRVLRLSTSDSSVAGSGSKEADLLLPPLWLLGIFGDPVECATETRSFSQTTDRPNGPGRRALLSGTDAVSDGPGLCLLRMRPSGSFSGTVLSRSEATGFSPVIRKPSAVFAERMSGR